MLLVTSFDLLLIGLRDKRIFPFSKNYTHLSNEKLKGSKMGNWKRLNICVLCGQSRCVVSTKNPRLAYCHRYQKTYFLSNDFQNRIGIKSKKKKKAKLAPEQEGFDFGDDHLEAIKN